jgi:hypothetical protein
MRVGIEEERPFIPPEGDLPGSPGGKRLDLYIELMKVGRFRRAAHGPCACVPPCACARLEVGVPRRPRASERGLG